MRTRRLLATATALGLTLGLALTAGTTATATATATPATASAPAASTAPTSAEDDRTQRLELACARVPNLLLRVEDVQTRLAADAGTVGSTAWLAAKAEAAESAGRTDLATVLRNRLRVRTELADVLPLRLENLQRAQEACTSAGISS